LIKINKILFLINLLFLLKFLNNLNLIFISKKMRKNSLDDLLNEIESNFAEEPDKKPK